MLCYVGNALTLTGIFNSISLSAYFMYLQIVVDVCHIAAVTERSLVGGLSLLRLAFGVEYICQIAPGCN